MLDFSQIILEYGKPHAKQKSITIDDDLLIGNPSQNQPD